MIETRKIEKRIANDRVLDLGLKIDALEIEGTSVELITELAVSNVLAELMESLKNGDSLEDAIQIIHINS